MLCFPFQNADGNNVGVFRVAVTDSGQPMDHDAMQQLLGDSHLSFNKSELKGGGSCH